MILQRFLSCAALKKYILELIYTEGFKPTVQTHAARIYAVEMPTDSVLRDIDTKGDYETFIV
jgi:CTP:molybdopterin cytidylyltransferase MocA